MELDKVLDKMGIRPSGNKPSQYFFLKLFIVIAVFYYFLRKYCSLCQGGKMGVDEMSLVVRKPVVWVSNQVRHKPGCTAKEDG